DDLRALVEKPLGVREPDALTRPGNDGDPVFESTHVDAPRTPAYERWIRLKRSVTAGSPLFSSRHTVSVTTNVIVRPLLSFSYRSTMRPSPTSTSDRKSTRLNSSHLVISYAVFCLKKKTN